MRICDVNKLKAIEKLKIVFHIHVTYTKSTNTYSSTQCPAVAIQLSLIIAPPHRWVLEKPKNDVRRTDTCHGHRPNIAFLPPTIRVSGRWPTDDMPHSEKKFIFYLHLMILLCT